MEKELASGKKSVRELEKRPKRKKRVCTFCADKDLKIDFKDVFKIRRFMSERAKILPRRITRMCSYHQRFLTLTIKRARFLALLPYCLD